jgi:hypothetical protein
MTGFPQALHMRNTHLVAIHKLIDGSKANQLLVGASWLSVTVTVCLLSTAKVILLQ